LRLERGVQPALLPGVDHLRGLADRVEDLLATLVILSATAP
jgi:hypothetical protein